jgi:serine/threonine protein kinase
MEPEAEIGYYRLKTNIAKGGFGSIWTVKTSDDPELYAMKLEPATAKRQTLQFEVGVLKRLQGSDKFPAYVADGKDQGFVYCVMELFGPSLDRIIASMPGRKLALEYIPSLTAELLAILEQFHAKGYVHRDIKPGNFVARLSGSSPLALIDFGVSKVYMDFHSGTILEQKEYGAAVGSQLYSSPSSANHIDMGRRDDLYSLMYAILDMAGFRLPWKGQSFEMDCVRLKTANPLSALLEQISPAFAEIGRHIEGLEFASAPNYALLKTLAMRDAKPTPVRFQWMAVRARDSRFTAAAAKLGYECDPTGMLLEMCPHVLSEKKSGCLLL